jgi:hypothetical protein
LKKKNNLEEEALSFYGNNKVLKKSKKNKKEFWSSMYGKNLKMPWSWEEEDMEEEPGVLSFQSMGRRRRTTTTTTTTRRRFELGCMGSIRIVGGLLYKKLLQTVNVTWFWAIFVFWGLFCGFAISSTEQ